MGCLFGSEYKTGDGALHHGGNLAVLLKSVHKPSKILSLYMFRHYCLGELPWHMADRTLWRLCVLYSGSSVYESGDLERLL